jgi:thioesterase domain-containing protein
MSSERERPQLFVIAPSGYESSLDVRIGALRQHIRVHFVRLGDLSCFGSVEQAADASIAHIRKLQPDGPYHVLGCCIGGLIAFESAARLLGEDEAVQFLGLIDARRPRNDPAPRALAEEQRSLYEDSRHWLDIDHNSAYVAGQLMRSYCPQPLPIPVHCYFTQSSNADPSHAWHGLLGDRARCETYGTDQLIDWLRERISGSIHDHHYTPIVSIQSGASHCPPVFCVPGAGGSVTGYIALSRALGVEVPVYGLQPRGLDGSFVPHYSVEAAATAYLQAVRRIWPHGPYRLLGHSFGGWIVLEMAQRLLTTGESVAPLAIVDSQSPTRRGSSYVNRIDTLMKLIAILQEASGTDLLLQRRQLVELSYEAQLQQLAYRMKSAGLLARKADVQVVRNLVRVFSTNLNTGYIPSRRYPGRVLLFLATEHSPPVKGEIETEADDGVSVSAWANSTAQLDALSLPGNHMTMLREPNIEAIAERWRAAWNSIPSASPTGVTTDLESSYALAGASS